MEPFNSQEISSIKDEIYYLRRLFEKDIDAEMHLSCNVLYKQFQGINNGYDKCEKLDNYNKEFYKIKQDTLDICKLVERSVVERENLSD